MDTDFRLFITIFDRIADKLSQHKFKPSSVTVDLNPFRLHLDIHVKFLLLQKRTVIFQDFLQ